MRKALWSWLPFVAAIPVLAMIGKLDSAEHGFEYLFVNLNHVGIAIILAVSLNLVNGLTGQFSIGHAGFMAVGRHVSAVMLMRGPHEAPYRLFFLLTLLTVAPAAALAGSILGTPSLRLPGAF